METGEVEVCHCPCVTVSPLSTGVARWAGWAGLALGSSTNNLQSNLEPGSAAVRRPDCGGRHSSRGTATNHPTHRLPSAAGDPAAGGPRRGAAGQGGLQPDMWRTQHTALSSGAHYYPQLGVHTLQQ